MDEQTRKLLEECCVGCKMAVESFGQVKEYVKDTRFRELIDEQIAKHQKLEDEAVSLPPHRWMHYGYQNAGRKGKSV